MTKIKKYNSYDKSIKAGDVVVFIDDTKKTIARIDGGHRVVFGDGTKCDLWAIEGEIKGIDTTDTKMEQIKPVAKPINFNSIQVEPLKSNKVFSPLATSYKELNKLLYHGGKNIEFYHLTAAQNALEIINGKYLYSREAGEGHIKYDNAILNDTSGAVMGSNYSYRTEKYVRFYLNIQNGATYSFHKNITKNKSFEVIIAVGFSSIWKTKTNVILSPINAHYLRDEDYDWSKYNIAIESNLKNHY